MNGFQPALHALQLRAQGFARSQQRGDLLTLGLGESDRFGVGIALGAKTVRLDLRALALLFERGKACTSSTKPRLASAAATPGKSLRSSFGSSTIQFLAKCEAFTFPASRACESRARRAASASPILISKPRVTGT